MKNTEPTHVLLGIIDVLFFAAAVVVILLLVGCASTDNQAEDLNDALADHAVTYCLWSVYDSYGDMTRQQWADVLFACEADYMRYLDWRWEELGE